jgi:DNA repair protein RadC
MLEKKRERERGFAEATPHYFGHRERLRDRFREAGADALSDYELLELLLFRAQPRRDVKPLAKALLEKFGSFAEVISAPETRLAEVKGPGASGITEFKIVQAAASRLLRGAVKKRPVLSSWSSVLDYCRGTQAFDDRERFRVLFLDKRNQLIANRRSAADRHRRSHAGLSARSGQARARIVGIRHHPGAQSSVRRSDAVARGHPDDTADHRGGFPARHCRA